VRSETHPRQKGGVGSGRRTQGRRARSRITTDDPPYMKKWKAAGEDKKAQERDLAQTTNREKKGSKGGRARTGESDPKLKKGLNVVLCKENRGGKDTRKKE